jgi:hypothetical protein
MESELQCPLEVPIGTMQILTENVPQPMWVWFLLDHFRFFGLLVDGFFALSAQRIALLRCPSPDVSRSSTVYVSLPSSDLESRTSAPTTPPLDADLERPGRQVGTQLESPLGSSGRSTQMFRRCVFWLSNSSKPWQRSQIPSFTLCDGSRRAFAPTFRQSK